MVNREQGHPLDHASPHQELGRLSRDYKDKDFFLSDRFIGASWESLPVDLSEKEECQVRCFGTEDDMSNWAPKPKYMIAEGDTYTKWPDDETYPQLAINYIKLDNVPLYNESWAPIIDALRSGNFFGTTGEVLFHNWGVEGTGAKRVYTANIEYTFPLEFADLVWSDGTKVQHKIINLTDTFPSEPRSSRSPLTPPARSGFGSPYGIPLETVLGLIRSTSRNLQPAKRKSERKSERHASFQEIWTCMPSYFHSPFSVGSLCRKMPDSMLLRRTNFR